MPNKLFFFFQGPGGGGGGGGRTAYSTSLLLLSYYIHKAWDSGTSFKNLSKSQVRISPTQSFQKPSLNFSEIIKMKEPLGFSSSPSQINLKFVAVSNWNYIKYWISLVIIQTN